MKSHQKMIAVLSVLSMVLMASPTGLEVAQAKQAVTQGDGVIKPEQLDQEIFNKLDRVYQELSGSPDMKMKWEQINEGPDDYFLSDAEGNQAQIKRKTGEVHHADWNTKVEQVDEALRTAATTAVKEMDPSLDVSFDKARRIYQKDGGMYTSLTGSHIWVTLKQEKVSSILLKYNYTQVPQAVKKTAEQLLQALDAKSLSFHEVTLNGTPNKSTWSLTARDNSNQKRVTVSVNGQTCKPTGYYQSWNAVKSLLSINDKKYSKFKNTDVLAAAKPKAKKMFGIDLTGYNVARGKGETANYFTFKKEGKPEVSGFINEKGEFYELRISSK